MNKSTPGPWTVCVHDNETTIEAEHFTIATNVGNSDADLIAAAPDLLAALKLCVSFCRGHQETPEKIARYEQVCAVIAKAEGQS